VQPEAHLKTIDQILCMPPRIGPLRASFFDTDLCVICHHSMNLSRSVVWNIRRIQTATVIFTNEVLNKLPSRPTCLNYDTVSDSQKIKGVWCTNFSCSSMLPVSRGISIDDSAAAIESNTRQVLNTIQKKVIRRRQFKQLPISLAIRSAAQVPLMPWIRIGWASNRYVVGTSLGADPYHSRYSLKWYSQADLDNLYGISIDIQGILDEASSVDASVEL